MSSDSKKQEILSMVKRENIALKTLTRVTQIIEILDKEISNYINLFYILRVIIMYRKENALNIKL